MHWVSQRCEHGAVTEAPVIEPRVLLVHIPELRADGAMLSGAAVHGVLSGRPGLSRAALATTVATGREAGEHGIFDDSEPDPFSGELRPVSGSACLAPPFWSVAREAGLVAHALGWPASDGSQAGGGVTAAATFFSPTSTRPELWAVPPHSIEPADRVAAFADLRVHPGELTGVDLLPFFPELTAIDQACDKRPAQLAAILAHAAGVHAAATALAAESGWRLLAVHYDLLAAGRRDFGGDERISGALTQFALAMLRRLCELAEGASIILVCPSESGRFAISGSGVRRSPEPVAAGLTDLAPTVLARVGVAVPADMPGRVLGDAFDPPLRPSWGAGWAETPAFIPVSSLPADRRLRIAAARLQQGQFASAIPELEALSENPAARLCLAWACVQSGQYARCEEVLAALAKEGEFLPAATLIRAHLLQRTNDVEAALRLTRELRQAGAPAAVLASASELLLAMGRGADAVAAAGDAVAADGSLPEAYLALAAALLRVQRAAEAAAAARACIRLDARNAGAHIALAQALAAGAGDRTSAIAAFRTAAELAPNGAAGTRARRWIQRLGGQ